LRKILVAIAMLLFIVSSPTQTFALRSENLTTTLTQQLHNIRNKNVEFVVPINSISYSCPQWEHLMKKYKLPVKEFSYIAKRESGCRIKAINAKFNKHGDVIWTLNKNGSIDRGLFQINSIHKATVRKLCKGNLDLLLKVDCNLKVAAYLYQRYGLVPWRVVSSS
jgi:hypothetical protein